MTQSAKYMYTNLLLCEFGQIVYQSLTDFTRKKKPQQNFPDKVVEWIKWVNEHKVLSH